MVWSMVFSITLFFANADEIGSGRSFSNAGAPPVQSLNFDHSQYPDIAAGCSSEHSTIGGCGTNTRNRFNFASQGEQPVTCNQRDARRCSSGQSLVCSSHYRVKVCVDINLATTSDGTPRGNFTMPQCREHCAGQGKRMLTNNEWLVASLGTNAANCLPSSISRRPDWNSRTEMRDLSFNTTGIRSNRGNCVSTFGIRDMVGVLGQWVTDGQAASNRAQFNGGLWPQNASNIFYRTTAHGPGYTDYSIGCRCASRL